MPHTEQPPKRLAVALFLAVFLPSFGHLYMGAVNRFCVLLFLFCAGLFAFFSGPHGFHISWLLILVPILDFIGTLTLFLKESSRVRTDCFPQ